MMWLRMERYLGGTVIAHTLLVLFVLLLVLGFVELSIQLGKLNEHYTLEKGVLYTLLKLPVYGYEIFPVALLMGALMGLGALASRSELIILRTGGWSVQRIFWGVAKSALLFSLLMVAVGEYVAPPSEVLAKKLRAEALHQNFSIGSGQGLWLRQKVGDQSYFVQITKVVNEHQLAGVWQYHEQAHRPVKVLYAPKAVWDAERQQWVLHHVRLYQLRWQPLAESPWQDKPVTLLEVDQIKQASLPVSFTLKPEMLTVLQVDTRYMGIQDLLGYITFLKANHLDTRPYELALWRKAALPLTLLAMLLIVFPLVFGSIRQVSMGQRIFVGVLLGLGYHYISQLIGNLTLVFHLPVWWGVFLPPLLLGAIGWYGIWRLDHAK